MDLYFVSIAMAILANVSYHLCMKQTNPDIHPVVSLAFTYFVAMLSCFVLLPFVLKSPLADEFKNLNWASPALGVSIVILEIGFVLAYRAGWNISTAAIYANIAVGVLLLPVGLLFFRERFTPATAAGLVFSVLGLYLLGKK